MLRGGGHVARHHAARGVGFASAILPVANAARSGAPGYDFALRHGLFAPVQTPRPIAQRLRAPLAAATRDEATQRVSRGLGWFPFLTPRKNLPGS
jgi:hypothetical protein